MDVDKATVLKKAVDGVGRHAAHPESGGKQVGPGPQVGNSTQILYAVALLLEGIVRGGHALYLDLLRFYLQGLLGLGRKDQGSGDNECRPHILSGNFLVIVQSGSVHNHLQVAEAGAVVQLNKAKGLHVPDGAGPAAYGDGPAIQLRTAGVDRRDLDSFHILSPSFQ